MSQFKKKYFNPVSGNRTLMAVDGGNNPDMKTLDQTRILVTCQVCPARPGHQHVRRDITRDSSEKEIHEHGPTRDQY